MQETVNQYVWIPVEEINDMVMCENNNKLADENGNKICNLVYNEETDTLECTNPAHATTATNLVGRLYIGTESYTTDESGNTIFSYTINFEQTDQTYDENSDNREPAIVTGEGTGNEYDGDSCNLEKAGMLEGSTAQNFLEQMQSDFTVMAKSVAKNGGFYISRYEVGERGSSKKGQKVLIADNSANITEDGNYLGANTWYGLYNTIRDVEANKQMIWGCQYDQVIKFLKEREEDSENGHTNRKLTKNHALSGQNELDCMLNIYDLEGNCKEWTAEAASTNSRATRGSYWGVTFYGYL